MSHRPPQLTLTSRLLIKAAGVTESWSRLTQRLICFLALAIVVTLDLATGSRVNLLILYLLVSAFAGWSFGDRRGLLFALLIASAGAALRHFEHDAHPFPAARTATEAMNFIGRLMSTSLIVVLVSGMRMALQLERWRTETDGLTGALNKTAFLTRMNATIVAGRAADRSFVLCYMDLDGFKLVNDRHGHSAGDKVLQIFAAGAVEAIREGDLFARMGGDEFIALLEVPGQLDGDHVASMVHARVSEVLARTGLPVTCSMGALLLTASQVERLDVAIQDADALMYEVKHGGRNSIRIGRFEPAPNSSAPSALEIPDGVIARGATDYVRHASVDRRAA